MEIPYRMLLVPRDKGFSIQIPELRLFAHGPTEAAAAAALNAEKKRFFERYIEAGEPADLPPAQTILSAETSSSGQHLARVALTSLVATGVAIATVSAVLVLGSAAAYVAGTRAYERFSSLAMNYIARREQEWEALSPEQRKLALACVAGLGYDPKGLTSAISFLIVTPTCQPVPASNSSPPR